MTMTERISGGAGSGYPQCQTCVHRTPDSKHPGWGWCCHPSNRVYADGWPQGFTPSQSPDGTCLLHPVRAAASLGQAVGQEAKHG
jgi:hypothetical protein